jgi:PIN domain nuclease of toxin-antitoxin system
MLIAQAQAENVALISHERTFDAYGIRRIDVRAFRCHLS